MGTESMASREKHALALVFRIAEIDLEDIDSNDEEHDLFVEIIQDAQTLVDAAQLAEK